MTSEIIVDPETNPTATYAVDPARVRALARRVVCGPHPAHFVTHTPLTGAPLASLPSSSPEDVAAAVRIAGRAQRVWARSSFRRREHVMLAFHDIVLRRQAELLDLVQLESGKTRRQAFEEVADVALVARHYARTARHLLRDRRLPGLFPVLTRATEVRHPKGVVGVISPWNYPLTLAITDAIPAIMAGNAVVLRPDPQASVTALAAVEMLADAGLPEGVLTVVLGDGPTVGQAVVDSVDYVCFTGSTPTGRHVGAAAARRLVGVSLELGGKNSMYIAADADLDRAVNGAIRGCFSSAGQLCISKERLLVHEAIADEFTERFVANVKTMRLGADLAYGNDMGPLASAAQLEKVQAHVEDARSKGAVVLTGGRARPELGPYFYEPTVLTRITNDMHLRDDETFGPVVSIYRVASDDAAVELANDTDYGLNAAIFTRDVRHGRALAARIEAGTVNINEAYGAAWGSIAAPMGGMKASGVSRRHGVEGLLKYTEAQTIASQHLIPLGPAFGMGEETWTKAMTAALRVLKAVGRS